MKPILAISWGSLFRDHAEVLTLSRQPRVMAHQLVSASVDSSVRPVLVLPGGSDISTCLYGQVNMYSDGGSADRDMVEVFAYLTAKRLGIPVLGICRGHQLMAALEGGCLVQDMQHQLGVTHKFSHELVVLDMCPPDLSAILNDYVYVNSLHHQAVLPASLPAHAAVVATAGDGIVEAIVYPNGLGVQWHPEMLNHFELLEWVANLGEDRGLEHAADV